MIIRNQPCPVQVFHAVPSAFFSVAAREALTFHQGIGAKRNEERLRYLKDYWAGPLEKLPGVRILTSFDPALSCGTGTFLVENMDMSRLSQVLFEKHKVFQTVLALPDEVRAIRVTPSISTTLGELDIFSKAVTQYIRNGMPSG